MFFRKKTKVTLAENQITLRLSHANYSVYYNNDKEGLRRQIDVIKKGSFSQHIVITNTTVEKLYRTFIKEIFPEAKIILLADGESQKSLKTVEQIANKLAELHCDRKTLLWAFGGGVIGDITGFVAAIYMRGISFAQLPTTLLAMVDSSVGGKTGVNLRRGKNFLGSFHQPVGVITHLPVLKTLPRREINCGLAEIIKTALIYDSDFFGFIEENAAGMADTKADFLRELCYRSVAIKADIVSKDEKEQNLRSILNFGHTLAHAIEGYFQYQKIKHGEAVAIGLGFAAFFSYKKHFITHDDFLRVYELLKKLKLPHNVADLPVKNLAKNKKLVPTLLGFMQNDKKNKAGQINFIFIHKIGAYLLPQAVEKLEIEAALQEYFRL